MLNICIFDPSVFKHDLYVCLWMYVDTFIWASHMVLVVKNPPTNAGDVRDNGLILARGRSLEEGMATHSSIFAWRIPWTEEPGGLQSIGSQRVRHDWSYWACMSMNIATVTPDFSVAYILKVYHLRGNWCTTISSSNIPFSSCFQSFSASGSFPKSQFFASGGQSFASSALASVLPMNI